MFPRTFITAAALFTATWAIKTPSAIVVIEASHGGAGQDLTNTTVKIPFTYTYSNNSALAEVSTLYLVGSTGDTPLDTITCTPFKNADGTGNSGLAFNSTTPSYLSTNTVQVGSIVCISTDISMAPPGGPPGGPNSLSVSLSSSVFVTSSTSPKAAHHHSSTKVATTHSSDPTHTKAAKPSASSASSGSSASSSAPVAQATGNAASSMALSGEFFGGLALAGFGLAFAL